MAAALMAWSDSAARPALIAYVIYASPTDYPCKFVMRRFFIDGRGVTPDAGAMVADTLEGARAAVPEGKVVHQPRPDDEPQIVETWI